MRHKQLDRLPSVNARTPAQIPFARSRTRLNADPAMRYYTPARAGYLKRAAHVQQ
jgi:hypothetical protein